MKPAVIVPTVLAAFTAGVVAAPAASYAAGYFSTTKTVTGLGTVSCGTGWRVTGGGTDMLKRDVIGTTTSTAYKLISSRPTATGWTASAVRVGGYYSNTFGWRYTTFTYTPRVYALCVR